MDFKNYYLYQGVDSLSAGHYLTPFSVSPDNSGLLDINTKTGASTIEFAGRHIFAVAQDTANQVVGIATDGQGGFYAFSGNTETDEFHEVGYIKQAGIPKYGFAQGEYDYDSTSNTLYISGVKGNQAGLIAIDFSDTLDSISVDFTPGGDLNGLRVVNGEPVGLPDTPNWNATLQQGVSTGDGNTLYWAGTDPERNVYGIAVFSYEDGQYSYDKFIATTPGFYFNSISYDKQDRLFYAAAYDRQGTAGLVAVDRQGEVFTLGTSSVDNMIGTRRDNFFMGLAGDDVLSGGTGDDKLSGGLGADELTGGKGCDHFIFRSGDGQDIVFDFRARGVTHDVIDLRFLSTVHSFKDLMDHHVESTSDGALIDGLNGDSLLLRGISVDDLQKGDFLI